jgi:exopolyphosphatase / guanosine-5'-triphosphate,3'-diphosphate pyrophosphatase
MHMNVAVVDVGSNTIRLLVATRSENGLAVVARGKRMVGLGADVERHGVVSAPKLGEAAECLAGFADIARAAGAALLDVVVASPGRQAENAAQLVHTLSRAAGSPARVLSREEEARLAFEGAVASSTSAGVIAVCDIGGGSTQVAVGTVEHGPAWLRSVDLGSLRLSARVPCCDPPTKEEVSVMRSHAEKVFARLTPPLPKEAIAVGGTARAVKKLVGRSLGPDELREALGILRGASADAIAAEHGVEIWRARSLPGGVAILLEVQRLLGVPLEVGRGGLREGLALELLDRLPAVQSGGGR